MEIFMMKSKTQQEERREWEYVDFYYKYIDGSFTAPLKDGKEPISNLAFNLTYNNMNPEK